MAMAVEGILSTVLKDQPFIFDEEKEANENKFPSCLEQIGGNTSSNSNYPEDFDEHPFTLDDDYTNLNTENAANQFFQQNQEISNLNQMQKDVLNKFLPDLLSIKPKDPTKYEIFGGDLQETDSSNNYMCINNIQELNTDNTSNTMPLNNEIKVKPDYESFDYNNTEQSDKEIFNIQNNVNESDLFVGVKKEDSETDTPNLKHVDMPPCTYQGKSNSDIYNDLKLDNSSKNKLPALNYSLNLGDYAINNSNNDDANSTSEHFNHDVPQLLHLNSDLNMTLAPSEESRNESVIESTIRNDLDDHDNLQCLPLFFTITSAVSNPEDFMADCSKELEVVSLDFNMAKEKRIIFIGSNFCKNCKKRKPACNCWVTRKKGGMCEKCGKIIAYQDHLRKHLTKCQTITKTIYTCEKCNSIFSKEYMYKRHLKNIADAPVCNYLQCKLCSVKFTKTDFKEHIKEHPNHLCSKCGRSFATTTELHSHSKGHQRKTNSEKMELVCHLCGKQCSTVPNLKHHINMHTRKKTETCQICKKMYYSVSDVQKHMRSFHSGEEYACNICNKKFSSKPGLKNHVVVVHMRKPVETCKICNIQFARRDYYQFHVSRHHPSKFPHVPAPKPQKKPRKLKNIPAICTICERVFKNRATLRVHITSCHAHASRIKCRQCHMTFCSPASRARHEKLHENPYYKFGCKICFARNKSEKELQKHMKKSHSKKPKAIYQCYHCNEKFCRKYLLMVHIGNVHTPQNTKEVMDHIENNHIPQNTEEVKTKIDELMD